jgi:hypothetical protein
MKWIPNSLCQKCLYESSSGEAAWGGQMVDVARYFTLFRHFSEHRITALSSDRIQPK